MFVVETYEQFEESVAEVLFCNAYPAVLFFYINGEKLLKCGESLQSVDQ